MFLSEIRPLNPYMSAYLTGPDGNVSLTEVMNLINGFRIVFAVLPSQFMMYQNTFSKHSKNGFILTFLI